MDTKATRRGFLKTASLLAAGAQAGAVVGFAAETVAETGYGKIRGIDSNGIKIFRGIPYGGDTSGKNRFMPPTKPEKWTGVRDGSEWGHISPQHLVTKPGDYEKAIEWDKERGGLGEDCLNLNVWTPGLKGKRTVMVSYHGGGFTTGSGNLPGYDGEPLARFGNVVVVTVNHRLGPLGYTYLGDIAGPEYAYSGVAGMMDCVVALEWVRDNIAAFGGNPDSVMIFGQSGGGMKTSVLMAMPSAKGLFHRAGVQSGSALRLTHREAADKAAQKMLDKLGIGKSNLADLHTIPFQKIIDAGGGAGPMVDGKIIPRDPWDPTAPESSATVPMIIGTAHEDAGLRMTDWDLTEEGLKAWVKQTTGKDADRVLAAYARAYPNARPYLIKARIATDRGGRRSATTQAERKFAQGKASAYLYRWDWPSPADGGKFGAVHGTDVSLSFHNPKPPIEGGGTAEGKIMADKMGSTWVAFAKTGNPNNRQIPAWPAYNPTQRPTMLFDLNPHVVNDPDHEIRLLWDEISQERKPA